MTFIWIILFLGLAFGLFFAYPHKRSKAKFYEKMLLSISFFVIGGQGILFGFIPHVFFAKMAAKEIGWATSPFQFEVGVHDGCWGLLAILSLWFRGGFLLATCVGWSVFLLFAAYGHLKDTVLHHNYAPFNYGFIAGDLIPAIVILAFTFLYYKHGYKKHS